jgi:hypothetical protein
MSSNPVTRFTPIGLFFALCVSYTGHGLLDSAQDLPMNLRSLTLPLASNLLLTSIRPADIAPNLRIFPVPITGPWNETKGGLVLPGGLRLLHDGVR